MGRPVTGDDIGLKVLREAPAEEMNIIDIVAIHGLGAHPDDSWCKNAGTRENPQWINWLEEESMLSTVAPNARIMRYGYYSQWFGKETMQQSISTVVERLLRALKRKRKDVIFRPLLFVAHCFGGLVVLKALLEAEQYPIEWPGVFSATTGLIFFGTPFRGAEGMNQLEILEAARREYHEDEVQPTALEVLQPGNAYLQEVVDSFLKKMRSQTNKTRIACFFELESSNVGRIVGGQNRTRFVVSKSSGCLDLSDATSNYSLSRTHFDMNKFAKATEEDFETVADVVKDIVQGSPTLLSARSNNTGSGTQYNAQTQHFYLERPETPPGPSTTIPFPRDANFIERGTVLDEVHRRCAVAGSWAALVGLGGVGKSQLAIEYAYRTRDRSDETWVLWVHASSAARFEQSYYDIANRVKISGRKDPEANIFKLVHDWLCNSKDRWLLVLDNVDDALFLLDVSTTQRDEAANPRSAPIRLHSYIPHSERGSVLVTTRNQGVALQLVERRNIISVQPMNDAQAGALFRKMLKEEEDCVSIDTLAAELEYMPLAIAQAAAYITQRAPRYSVKRYLDEFRRSDRKKTSLLIHDEIQLRRDREAKNSILVTWQISFEQIQQTRPSAADLLSLMSFFDRQGIPAGLLQGRTAQTGVMEQQEQEADNPSSGEEGEGDNGFEDDVVTLRNFCFISVERDSENFEMLALVQLATQRWLDANNRLGQWRKEFITLMAREFPSGSFKNRTRCQMLLPHVAPMFEKKPTEEELLWDWTQVLSNAGWYLWTTGQYKEAEDVARKALETSESIAGKDAVLTLHSVGILALVLQAQGKYEAAEAMNRRALEGREKVLGKEHPDTLTSMNYLLSVLQNQGKYDGAGNLAGEHYEAKPGFIFKAGAESGTDVDQISVGISQDETLIRQTTRTMPKERNVNIPDDTSIASHTTTKRERLGKNYIANFLANDEEMRELCMSMLDRIDRERFVDIGQQMLKSFYLSLLEYAKTELEKQSFRLLKSRSGRKRIFEDIADIITFKDTQNEKEKRRTAEQLLLTEQRLERFIMDVPDTYPDLDLDQQPENEDEFLADHNDVIELKEQDTETSEEEFENQYDDLAKLAKMKAFFRKSEPFQVLLSDLRQQLLPHLVKDILQVVPQGSLWLSDEHNNSLGNRMKAFVENFTMLEWNWWPLEPRMRALNSNETRLFWHCYCGTRLWQEISRDDADLIKPILSNRTTDSALLQRCKRSRGFPFLIAKLMAFAAPQSVAGRRYTPNITEPSHSGTQDSRGTGVQPSFNNQLNSAQAANQAARPGTYTTNIGHQVTSIGPRILFGVKGPNPALKLEQIEIKDTTNDSDFYDELKKHYRLNRGRFRYWFSFWRLGYCEVVKFQAYRPDYVIKEYKELPTGDDYDYLPRHPEAQNPPVSKHEFSMYLNACGYSCRWALLKGYVPVLGTLLHDCLPQLSTKRAIKRIPKKKSPFDTSSTDDQKAYAWGLEARHEISAVYVAFYHCFILALPFGFWGWWQATHAGDLQNASVPVTVALTMLSLFWGTNGILTQGRKLGETGI